MYNNTTTFERFKRQHFGSKHFVSTAFQEFQSVVVLASHHQHFAIGNSEIHISHQESTSNAPLPCGNINRQFPFTTYATLYRPIIFVTATPRPTIRHACILLAQDQ
jgi:hypothetical protein